MEENKTYHWKQFSRNKYILSVNQTSNISTKDLNLTSVLPFFEENGFIISFINKYSSFTIDKNSKKLIENLIQHYKLPFEIGSICLLSASLQEDYINYFENPINTSKKGFEDVEKEYLEYKELFDLVEKHLFNKHLNDFDRIIFSFKKSYTFKSIFVFKELMSSFIAHHGITIENFSEKKTEILASKSNLKLDKLSEFHKLNYIQGLFNLITSQKEEETISNELLRFIVCFLLLSQIPVNKMASEFTLPSNPDDVAISDINNIRRYINGDKKLFY
ncbi:hypothetical protein [Flavobacterium psychrophilum]|uniref:hypothetical protein n=1 Tax=Flavobacterium psychrophilum TaxID=96345 RepID=UPI000B7C32F1|nr:hypothetical protein [Flavobacterium psychrophilum]MBF1997813.1 hypothetical protein [Flavobacterium psychrophilum]MBF2081685.1 hypothetical protein [Flavobacterium psychrophilum]MBM4674756.1 hypothetical protein [Flavobacterium psychrophilum]MCB5980355.1 hypothetical protein [Flavobacterium psychrophilum]MCB5984079.1 hypothetical protein [Flavobacterium psychrophilum]